MTDCPFCEPPADPGCADGRLVFEDDLIRVLHTSADGGSAYAGALLLVLRRHTPGGLADLTDAEGQRLGLMVARLSRSLRARLGALWTYSYCFTEGFRHVHQFVVARYPGTPPEFVRLGLDDWTAAPRIDAAGVRRLVQALATDLARPAVGPRSVAARRP